MKVSNETKVGVLAAVAITILILGYNFLKDDFSIFKDDRNYVVEYDKIQGLGTSNPVQINGFVVGRVSSLTINPQSGKIIAILSITEPIQFPSNTIARIVSADLLGSKAVTIELGDSKEFLVPNDTLKGALEGDLVDMVREEIRPIQIKTEKMLGSIDSVINIIQVFLNKGTLAKVDNSFQNLEHAMRVFANTSERIDTLVAKQSIRLDQIMANVQSITHTVKNNSAEMERIMKNTASITDSIAASDLNGAISNAERALSDVSDVLQKINNGEGSLGMLVNDKELYENLTKTSKDLDELIVDIETYPSRYFSIIVGRKDKRERQQLKEDKKQERQDKKDARRNGDAAN